MAKVAEVTEEDIVDEAAIGFVSGDLDLPDVELHPAQQVKVQVKHAKVQMSKSSGLPTLAITAWLSPDNFQFGFDPNNAPDGITSTIYVAKVSFGFDMGRLTAGNGGQQGVSIVRKLFGKLRVPFSKLVYGPREDLNGAIFLTDECLARLEGAEFMTQLTVETNDRTGEKENRFQGIIAIP